MQQAIDILDEMIKSYEGNNGNWNADFILGEAKSRIQALGNGWIPVTERLPSVGGNYLVYDGDSVYDCNFKDNRFVIYNNGYEYFQNVTHWMPIPLPPKTNDGFTG